MHIERIHNIIEELSEVIENEFANGTECVDTCEMGAVADILKDLVKAEYYATITKSMNNASTDEVLTMLDRYGDRRYYKEPYYHMTPDMYKMHDAEWYRDMDKAEGRLYYSEPTKTMDNMKTAGNDLNSRYENAKRGYEESKHIHKTDSPEDKQAKMRDLEVYMKELSEDVSKLIMDATPEEKTVFKNKMAVLMQKIQ